jgi:trigger factor
LIQDSFVEAIQEHNLNIVGGPQLDPPELNPDSDYVFDITVEVKPELPEIDYNGMSLEKNRYTVSADEIDAQIHMIQKTMAKKQKVDESRAVKDSDFVLIDYQGFLNDEPYEHTPKIENFLYKIGQGTLPEEFSEKLTGCVPVQDIEVEVAYPDDHPDENLKGRTIVYKVTLTEIQEEILPEINDDLVKGLGKFETLDQVRDSIRENLEKGNEQRVKHELSEQIFQHLLEKYEFEVPEAMIEGELNGIISETEQAYSANNTSLEEHGLSREALSEQYRDVAEKQARRHLILDKIITQEKMDLTEEEMEKSLEEMARGMNATVDAIKNFFKADPRQMEYYTHTQLEKKAIDLIIEKSQVTEKDPESDVQDTSVTDETQA